MTTRRKNTQDAYEQEELVDRPQNFTDLDPCSRVFCRYKRCKIHLLRRKKTADNEFETNYNSKTELDLKKTFFVFVL
jgi:hypothetical protein